MPNITMPLAIPRFIKSTRWIARIWSLLVTAGILLIFFSPDSVDAGPIAPVDIFLLSLTGVALLGLFIAWRWELLGGIFTIAVLFFREVAWIVLKGNWEMGFLILWVLILPPAILFLIAWGLERRGR